MATAILILHITVATSMIVIILLQRSEGGALGMGGGGGAISSRGVANLLTRLTAIFAGIFFATSIVLGILGHRQPPASAVGVETSRPGTRNNAPAGEGESISGPLPELKLKRTPTTPETSGQTTPIETPPAQNAPAAQTTPQQPAKPQVPQSQ